NANGRPVSRMTVMKKLRSEGLNSHSFRHSHATLLVEAGAPLKGVAGRLGHKQIEITDSIYTHNTEKMQRDTADIFAKSMQTNP
ncbi:MAG: tyrosine-type recombinase/integrase, partial [Selenomonadaceae bacterium]|nr:tyrosine-type recombinase/integrase [Selenomonadaceae bacterium]